MAVTTIRHHIIYKWIRRIGIIDELSLYLGSFNNRWKCPLKFGFRSCHGQIN